MALTLSNAAKSASANAVVDLLDVGSTHDAAYLALTTSADAVLVTIALNNPAFGSATDGVAELDVDPAVGATITDSGAAAKAKFYSRHEVLVFEGTVSDLGGTGDVKLNRASGAGTALAEGDSIVVASGTYTQP